MTKSKLIILLLVLMVKVSVAQEHPANTSKLDSVLILELDSIYTEDQQYRLQSNKIADELGRASKEYREIWDTIRQKDSSNLVFIIKIIEERGWLGAAVIGDDGNSTLFYVIQHSNQKTQEKYLPVFREAVANGNGKPRQLALMEDRVALGKGEKQIYGSQLTSLPGVKEYVVEPMIDPDNVDKRRAEVGLGTMQDYLANWDLTWDVEEYKKNLPELERKLEELKYK